MEIRQNLLIARDRVFKAAKSNPSIDIFLDRAFLKPSLVSKMMIVLALLFISFWHNFCLCLAIVATSYWTVKFLATRQVPDNYKALLPP